MIDPSTLEADIRGVLQQHAGLTLDADKLPVEADLYQAGMNSHASVNVMLGLEGRFDVEFPDRMLTRSVFSNIAAIRAALEELLGVRPEAQR